MRGQAQILDLNCCALLPEHASKRYIYKIHMYMSTRSLVFRHKNASLIICSVLLILLFIASDEYLSSAVFVILKSFQKEAVSKKKKNCNRDMGTVYQSSTLQKN